MLIVGEKRFIVTPFENEEELEQVVLENYDDIFGPDSVLLPKALIKSADGVGTVPDAFAIDLVQRRWYIVEAELLGHGVWRHIAPQVAKQLAAAAQASTRRQLLKTVISLYKSESQIRSLFAESDIPEVDVGSVVTAILENEPTVAIPIDAISKDLRLWAEQLKVDVRLWTIRKLVDSEDSSTVIYEIPDDFAPSLDISHGDGGSSGRTVYDVSVTDLIEAGLLSVGQTLVMDYKPRGGDSHHFEATIEEDGSISVLGKRFSSLSYAALHAMKHAGSDRRTKNGWRAWSTEDGRKLFDIREGYLADGQNAPNPTA